MTPVFVLAQYVSNLCSISLSYCKDSRSLKTISDYQNIIGIWHVVVMMDMEICCNGQFSLFLYQVSCPVFSNSANQYLNTAFSRQPVHQTEIFCL